MLVGGTAGQAIGGVIGQWLGWRAVFYVIGIPGLLLSFAILGLAEPPRGPRSEVVPLWRLLRVPAFFTLIVSGVMITFASVAFLTWGTDFVVRYKDFSLQRSGRFARAGAACFGTASACSPAVSSPTCCKNVSRSAAFSPSLADF